MTDLFLSVPSKKYQKSFEKYVIAYEKDEDDFYFTKYKKGIEAFDEYLDDLYKESQGIGLLTGEVTTSSFWLIHKNEVVGVARVRQQDVGTDGHIGYDISPAYRKKGYGSLILKLALAEANKLGIKETIITCNTDNITSKKIIEKNNGILLGTVYDNEEDENLYRYKIITN